MFVARKIFVIVAMCAFLTAVFVLGGDIDNKVCAAPAKSEHKPSDKIILTAIEVFGHHGCTIEEQKLGQKFYVDLELNLDLSKAGFSDDYADTVDYSQVIKLVEKIVGGKPRKLIETVAEELASQILKEFKRVESVKVTLHKPHAPLPMTYSDAAVTIYRER